MKDMKMKENIPILLVEDDEDDIRLVERAFVKGRILNKLYTVRDGEEAMEFLTNTGRHTDKAVTPRPGLILLDLNMPKVSGMEVLKWLKDDENLRSIPVVILTTSDTEKDIERAYDYGVSTFITKPVEFSNFLEAVITLGKYWLQIAQIPVPKEQLVS